MKRALIIHGWESNPKDHWYQEEKALLENMGLQAVIPYMPGDSFPIEKEWVKVIREFDPGEGDILIGHSLGAPAILRYLEGAKQKVGKVFLVAGFASSLHLDYPNAEYPDLFVSRPFNWAKIKDNVGEAYVLNQNDDEWVPKEKGIEIADNLAGKVILVEGTDHFDKMDLDLINKEI